MRENEREPIIAQSNRYKRSAIKKKAGCIYLTYCISDRSFRQASIRFRACRNIPFKLDTLCNFVYRFSITLFFSLF